MQNEKGKALTKKLPSPICRFCICGRRGVSGPSPRCLRSCLHASRTYIGLPTRSGTELTNHGRRPARRVVHQPQCLLVWLLSRRLLPRCIGLEVAVGARHSDEGEEDAEVVLELAREGSNGWIWAAVGGGSEQWQAVHLRRGEGRERAVWREEGERAGVVWRPASRTYFTSTSATVDLNTARHAAVDGGCPLWHSRSL